MKAERMNLKELNALKPSYNTPVIMECDTKFFTGFLSKIKVISPMIDGLIAVVQANKKLGYITEKHLYHYPSQKIDKIKQPCKKTKPKRKCSAK